MTRIEITNPFGARVKDGNFVWQLALNEIPHRLQPGVYQIRPRYFYRDGQARLWDAPLRRKITLAREPEDTPATNASVPPV